MTADQRSSSAATGFRWLAAQNPFPLNGSGRWFWQALLTWLLALLLVGCSLTVPNDVADGTNSVDSTDAVPTSVPEEIWPALARAVKAKSIVTTARLAQYVVVLTRNGELSDRDVAAFDAAFPKITAGSRDLTDVDVETLFDLGRKAKR